MKTAKIQLGYTNRRLYINRQLPIMEPLLDKMTRHMNPIRVAIAGVCSIFFKRFGLTLVWSVVVEVVFCLVTFCAWLPGVWWFFHYPAYFLMFGWLEPESGPFWHEILWWLLMFSAGVFQ